MVLAPPEALVAGLEDPLGALALLAVAGAALAAARMPEVDRAALHALAAVTVLYLASTELITAFQPVGGEAAVSGLGVRQQGQALLSGLWAVVGVATLLAGLVRDRHDLRVGALSLLSVTLAKVFLYDLVVARLAVPRGVVRRARGAAAARRLRLAAAAPRPCGDRSGPGPTLCR